MLPLNRLKLKHTFNNSIQTSRRKCKNVYIMLGEYITGVCLKRQNIRQAVKFIKIFHF